MTSTKKVISNFVWIKFTLKIDCEEKRPRLMTSSLQNSDLVFLISRSRIVLESLFLCQMNRLLGAHQTNIELFEYFHLFFFKIKKTSKKGQTPQLWAKTAPTRGQYFWLKFLQKFFNWIKFSRKSMHGAI